MGVLGVDGERTGAGYFDNNVPESVGFPSTERFEPCL